VNQADSMKKLLCAVAWFIAVHAAQGNAITNGSFETGNFTGWGPLAPNGQVVSGIAQDGTHAAAFGNGGPAFFLTQSIAFSNPGPSYDISFYLRNDSAGSSFFQASLDGFPFVTLTNSGVFGWTRFELLDVFFSVAPGDTRFIPLDFFGMNGGLFYLDNVQANPHGFGVPETLSGLWLALPFGLILALRGFRRMPAKL
jgi:hypothetical protein